jgi:hypothetical protein
MHRLLSRAVGIATAVALVASGTATLAAADAGTPIIRNSRVTVWDVAPGTAVRPSVPSRDTVIFLIRDGKAEARFEPAGAVPAPIPAGTRALVIVLDDRRAPPLPNISGRPPAFPRAGSTKLLENDRVVVWQSEWTPGVPTPMHFHDKDVVVTYLADGALASTDVAGQRVVNEVQAGLTRFNARDRVHTETLVRGAGRAVMVELK